MVRSSPSRTNPRSDPAATSARRSAGYAPRKIGSRNTRLVTASTRRAAPTAAGPEPAGRAVREQQVVGGGQRGGRLGPPRRVVAGRVPEERRAPRLVQGGPDPDLVLQPVVHRRRVVGEPLGRGPHRPAAGVL